MAPSAKVNDFAFGPLTFPWYAAVKAPPLAAHCDAPVHFPGTDKVFSTSKDKNPSVEAPTPWASAAEARGGRGVPPQVRLPGLGVAANTTEKDPRNGNNETAIGGSGIARRRDPRGTDTSVNAGRIVT